MFQIWTNLQLCHLVLFNHFPNEKNLKPFQTQEFADDSFRLDENGRKFSVMAESSLFFPTMFSKVLHCRHAKTMTCLGKGKF